MKREKENTSASEQLARIADGSESRRKRYDYRSQPQGQKPVTGGKNAVKLTTVPSSASEKFEGGKD